MTSARRDEISKRYGECFRAIDILECIPSINCDKLRKKVAVALIEEIDFEEHEPMSLMERINRGYGLPPI